MTAPIPLLRYDFRRPEFATVTRRDQYAACLEQCEWAERHGFGEVVLSEHHGLADGFLPAPLPVATAITGRTSRIRVTIAAMLLPLYDPAHVAEDLAVADLLSGGRVRAVAGIGYRDEEFALFGVGRADRGRRMEEQIQLILRAWSGEPIARHDRLVTITPTPASPATALLLVGGATAVGARRAADLGLGFYPAIYDPALADEYERACHAHGRPVGELVTGPTHGFVHVSEDPERDWARIAPHALHEANTYTANKPAGERSGTAVDTAPAGEITVDDLRASGAYQVLTPDGCVEFARSLPPGAPLVFHPLMGGLDPAIGWRSLELFAAKVLPRLGGG